jgi:ABC-type bacteriocin/lantibiotic exporter with double-glycine peptidase domain
MNVSYRMPEASDEEIAKVIADCELEPTVSRLAGGLSFKLSEGAPELSASERQKVQLARAMLGQPALLVLDEVDRDFDDETAARIADRLRRYEGAVVMAASSSAWRQRATKTFVIGGGAVRLDPTPTVRFSLIDGGTSVRESDET